MKLRKRLLVSLLVSCAASALLTGLEFATKSKLLFLLQLPVWFAWVSIWGVHSGPDNRFEGVAVWFAANALFYWVISLGLSFLVSRSGGQRSGEGSTRIFKDL
jgi:hypothetical protein